MCCPVRGGIQPETVTTVRIARHVNARNEAILCRHSNRAVLHGAGVFGVVVYVSRVIALCTGRMEGDTPGYVASVLLAASCVMIWLAADIRQRSAMIQSFFVLAALVALALRKRPGRNLPT